MACEFTCEKRNEAGTNVFELPRLFRSLLSPLTKYQCHGHRAADLARTCLPIVKGHEWYHMRNYLRLMSNSVRTFEDAVANAVINRFDALPAKRKPAVQVGEVRHWVPLSGIVVSRGSELDLECVALGYFYDT